MMIFLLIFCTFLMNCNFIPQSKFIDKFVEISPYKIHNNPRIRTLNTLFENDIRLTRRQEASVLRASTPPRRRRRKLAEPITKRWKMPIAFAFDGSHGPSERQVILKAIGYWEELTCIKFIEKAHVTPKLLFVKQNGCWSHIGFTRQANQTISIDSECQSNGTIGHEIGHALGFWHEQSRPDRDDFVRVNVHNIQPDKVYNFQTRSWADILVYDLPYDIGSVMHYGSRFYAKNENASLVTLEARDRLMQMVLGQRQELSFFDVRLANKAYCDKECRGRNIKLERPCKRDGYQDPKVCDQCRCPDGFAGKFCEKLLPPVNEKCGDVIDASVGGFITSPGYQASGYKSNIKCTWLLKAPQFHNVYLEFIDNFGFSCDADVCKDFIEVRHNTSLAITGPRFCCSKKPKAVLKSSTNEMLLLMRTFNNENIACSKSKTRCVQSNVGFKARYYIKPCGGGAGVKRQLSCVRRLTYPCQQTWTEGVKKLCPDWWHAKSCISRATKRWRESVCYKNERFCNPPYILTPNQKRCIVKNSSNNSTNVTAGIPIRV